MHYAHVLGSVHPCKHPWKTFRDVSKIPRGDIRKKKKAKKKQKKKTKKKQNKIKVARRLSGGKPEVLNTLIYHSLDCLIHVLLEITK